MGLQGKTQLKARFVAVSKDVTRPTAELWQKRATRIARDLVPNRGARSKGFSTGKLHDSIKVGAVRVQQGKVVQARVTMRYVGYFVDAGTQGHGTSSRINRTIRRRGLSGEAAAAQFARRTMFSKKARNRRGGGYEARPFREKAAVEAMKGVSMARICIDAWNGAA
jgi:hypothetical protein